MLKSNKKVANLVFNPFVNDSRVLKESLSLANSGYAVEVIAHVDKGLPTEEDFSNIKIKRLSFLDRKKSPSFREKLFAYLRYCKESIAYTKDFDILHCNDLNTLPIGVIVKRFFNKNVKIVCATATASRARASSSGETTSTDA